jgi:hypothetical protein
MRSLYRIGYCRFLSMRMAWGGHCTGRARSVGCTRCLSCVSMSRVVPCGGPTIAIATALVRGRCVESCPVYPPHSACPLSKRCQVKQVQRIQKQQTTQTGALDRMCSMVLARAPEGGSQPVKGGVDGDGGEGIPHRAGGLPQAQAPTEHARARAARRTLDLT